MTIQKKPKEITSILIVLVVNILFQSSFAHSILYSDDISIEDLEAGRSAIVGRLGIEIGSFEKRSFITGTDLDENIFNIFVGNNNSIVFSSERDYSNLVGLYEKTPGYLENCFVFEAIYASGMPERFFMLDTTSQFRAKTNPFRYTTDIFSCKFSEKVAVDNESNGPRRPQRKLTTLRRLESGEDRIIGRLGFPVGDEFLISLKVDHRENGRVFIASSDKKNNIELSTDELIARRINSFENSTVLLNSMAQKETWESLTAHESFSITGIPDLLESTIGEVHRSRFGRRRILSWLTIQVPEEVPVGVPD